MHNIKPERAFETVARARIELCHSNSEPTFRPGFGFHKPAQQSPLLCFNLPEVFIGLE